MSDAGLKIKISADVQQALRQLTQLTDATGELAVEGVGNITSVNEALKELRKAQQEVGDPKDLQLVNRALKDLGAEAKRLKSAGTEGFDEFGEKAKKAEGGVLGFANTAFSSLRKIAYVLPGIGVAGLIGALSEGIIDFFRSTSKEAEEAAKVNKEYFSTFQTTAPLNLEEAKKAVKEYQKIISDIVESTGKESAQVEILVARLHEGNLSRTQTVEVIKKLQSIAPDYFSKLNAEKASVDDVTAAYNKYNQALVASIEAQIRIGEITNLVKDRLNFERQAPDAAKFVNDLLAQGKSLDDISKLVTDNFRQQNAAAIKIGQANKANSTELQNQLDATNKIPFGVNTVLDYLRKEQGLLREISDAPLKDLGITSSGAKNLGNIADILKQVAAIYKELSNPDKRPIFMRREEGGLDLPTGEKSPLVQSIEAQIEEAKKKLAAAAGDSGLSDAYKKLITALNAKLASVESPDLAAHVNFTLANPEDAVKDLQRETSKVLQTFGKKIDLKVPANIKAELDGFDGGSFGISLRKALEEAGKNLGDISIFTLSIRIQLEKKEIQDQLDKQLGQILSAKGLQKDLAAAAAGFGDAIGQALASGKDPIQAAGKSILTALGTLIQDIGKNLIEYGIAKQFLDTVLSAGIALPGAVAIGLGIAAEAIGALVKGVGQSYHAFATGGIVTGPTLGLVGEAGPEVIFPLDRLNRFIQGTRGAAGQQVKGTFRIQGRDLALVLGRDSKNNSLV